METGAPAIYLATHIMNTVRDIDPGSWNIPHLHTKPFAQGHSNATKGRLSNWSTFGSTWVTGQPTTPWDASNTLHHQLDCNLEDGSGPKGSKAKHTWQDGSNALNSGRQEGKEKGGRAHSDIHTSWLMWISSTTQVILAAYLGICIPLTEGRKIAQH